MKMKNQKGVAAVEFALVLPLFLLITFGIIEFSLALYDQAVITNASREAARYGIVLTKPSALQIQQVATNYCSNHLISFGTGGNTCPSGNITVAGDGGQYGTPLTVTVKYQFTPLALGNLISPLSGALSLSATTVMYNE
ncbi:TadE/TadG family type IV pilus assembly protein [Cupriavidus necator]|nr:TadE/TadG family type IV pilus assembly protein [Cupriavidus necator]